jgi:hypothetical protein
MQEKRQIILETNSRHYDSHNPEEEPTKEVIAVSTS